MIKRPSKTHPTTDQLRNVIDRGEAADKVNASDPAAAPLGTDAEAGGQAPAGPEISTAIAEETRPASRRTHLPSALVPLGWFLALIAAAAAISMMMLGSS